MKQNPSSLDLSRVEKLESLHPRNMAEASSPVLSSLSSHHNRNLLIFCAVSMMLISALADEVPPVFMFGDSTFDVGTNNYIPSGATANFSYYGIDFPFSQATGRFSNGYNSADEIGKLCFPNFVVIHFIGCSINSTRNPFSFGFNHPMVHE